MRRSGSRLGSGLAVLAVGCAAVARAPCPAGACAPACPRDARRDSAGRCACTEGNVQVLGACVAPAVGDAYCGPGERIGADGCAARACAPDEAVDLATGACVARAALHGGVAACPDATTAVARQGRVVCLGRELTCPRGTRRAGLRCVPPPRCPPGTLPEGQACRVFVTRGAGPTEAPRVDVGAWAALVLGADGGGGSADLCRPLARRADAFLVGPGETRLLTLRVAVSVPDQDLSRVTAHAMPVLGSAAGATGQVQWPSDAIEVVERAVDTLVEPLRDLGGESSAAALELVVRCSVAVP